MNRCINQSLSIRSFTWELYLYLYSWLLGMSIFLFFSSMNDTLWVLCESSRTTLVICPPAVRVQAQMQSSVVQYSRWLTAVLLWWPWTTVMVSVHPWSCSPPHWGVRYIVASHNITYNITCGCYVFRSCLDPSRATLIYIVSSCHVSSLILPWHSEEHLLRHFLRFGGPHHEIENLIDWSINSY